MIAPICMLIPAKAHTKNISLRTAPASPRSQAFFFPESAPCLRPAQPLASPSAQPCPRRALARPARPPPPLRYFSFPQIPCMFWGSRLSLFFASSRRKINTHPPSPLNVFAVFHKKRAQRARPAFVISSLFQISTGNARPLRWFAAPAPAA